MLGVQVYRMAAIVRSMIFSRLWGVTNMNRLVLQLLGCLLFSVTVPVPAPAQIFECDGQWTNKPCGGSVTKQLNEHPTQVQSPEETERSRRKLWLHELDMLSLKAKQKYGVVPVLSPIQDLCLEEYSTSEECRKAIADKERELQTLMAEYAKAEAQKGSSSSVASGDDDATNVTVINQPPPVVYVIPRRRQIETYSAGGTSLAVNASGTIGESDVSVGISAETNSTFGTAGTSSGLPKSGNRGANLGSSALRQVVAPPSAVPVRPLPVPRAEPVPPAR